MRLTKDNEELRRIEIVRYLDGEPKTCGDISGHDGTISPDNIPTYILRLIKRGVLISKHTRGHYMGYKLDMPLAQALVLVEAKGYCEKVTRRMEYHLSEAYREKLAKKASDREMVKAIKNHVPAGDNPPWWGLITRRETIDCKLVAKK